MNGRFAACALIVCMLALSTFVSFVVHGNERRNSVCTHDDGVTYLDYRAPKAEVEPNNDAATATVVASGDYRVGSVNNATDEYDYYKINLTTSKMITVIMNFTGNDACDIDLMILDSAENVVDASYYYNPEYVSYTTDSTESGTFYIVVEAYDGAGNYEMNISVKTKPIADTNDDFATADSLTFTAGTATKNGNLYRNYDRYDYYKVPLHVYGDYADMLTVSLDTSSNWLDVDFNIWVYDPFGFTCVGMSSEIYDPYESVSFIANTNGTYFIEIGLALDSEGYDDSPSGEYIMTVDILTDQPYVNDGNNDPWNATEMSSWTDFRSGSLSVDNLNDFYKVNASNGDFIEIAMNVSIDADFDLYICKLLPAIPMPYGLEILNSSTEWMGETEYATLSVNATTAGTIYIVASFWDGMGTYGFNNLPPSIDNFAPSNALPIELQYGSLAYFSVNASDPNAGTSLTYTWYVDDEESATGTDNTFNFTNDYTGMYNVTVEVSDGLVYSYVDWQVSVNGRPKLNPSPLDERIYMNEGTTRTFSVDAQDVDIPMTYEWALDGTTLAASGSSYAFYADYESSGLHFISVKVTDSTMLYSVYSWEVRITDINRPPTIISLTPSDADVNIQEGDVQAFSVNANDPENGTMVTIDWYLDNNLVGSGSSYSLDSTGLTIGMHVLRVSVTDSNEASPGNNESSWNVNIIANAPPYISASAPSLTWAINENSDQVFSVTATDAEGKPLTYTWQVNGNQVASGSSSSYDFVTNYSSAGSYVVTVIISDGVKESRLSWNLTVADVSQAPQISTYTPSMSTITIQEAGGDLTFSISATDPDGLVSASQVSWFINDSEVGTGFSYTYTPTYDSAGVYVVKAVVRDSSNAALKVNMTWLLTVQDKNRAPVAVISAPANLAKYKDSQKITFDASGSNDPDGEEITFKWSDGIKILSTSSMFETKLKGGTHTITLEVKDIRGLSSNATVTLKVSTEQKSPGFPAVEALGALALVVLCAFALARVRGKWM